MATETGLLPSRSRPKYETAPIRVPIRRSGKVLDPLSSQMARTILAVLAEKPMTVTEIAGTVGTSVQNAMYHTNNLREAKLIAMVDTWYSEKGKEMPVYAASCETIVLTTESEDSSLTHHDLQT
jgi:predicted transcriptional regulator